MSSLKKAVNGIVTTIPSINYNIIGSDAAKMRRLRPEIQRKVGAMFKYAQSKGWTLQITSGYRSTQEQTHLYNE